MTHKGIVGPILWDENRTRRSRARVSPVGWTYPSGPHYSNDSLARTAGDRSEDAASGLPDAMVGLNRISASLQPGDRE